MYEQSTNDPKEQFLQVKILSNPVCPLFVIPVNGEKLSEVRG